MEAILFKNRNDRGINTDAVNAAIAAVEGTENCRSSIGAGSLGHALMDIEDRLRISREAMIGVTIDIDWWADFNLTNETLDAIVTHAVITCTEEGWVLEDLYRGQTNQDGKRFNITFTEAAKQAILESCARF